MFIVKKKDDKDDDDNNNNKNTGNLKSFNFKNAEENVSFYKYRSCP